MPTPIPLDEATAGTLMERVLGPSSKQRSVKTYIPTAGLSARFNIVQNHAHRLAMAFARLHRHAHPDEDVPDERELRRLYHSIPTYEQFHLGGLEHLSSLKGFSLRVTLGRSVDDVDARPASTAGADTTAPTVPGHAQSPNGATPAATNGHAMRMT